VEGREYKKIKKLRYLGGDFILKQTVNPDPGMAVKEVFFTKKGNTLYAILPRLPEKPIKIKEIPVTASSVVTLLGLDRKLKYEKDGDGIVVTIPALSINEIPFQNAYVLKITDVR
jgi:alpha-L-fucosidase